MDNDSELAETSTPLAHDRGEISGKPVGSAHDEDDTTSERLIEKAEQAETELEQSEDEYREGD